MGVGHQDTVAERNSCKRCGSCDFLLAKALDAYKLLRRDSQQIKVSCLFDTFPNDHAVLVSATLAGGVIGAIAVETIQLLLPPF